MKKWPNDQVNQSPKAGNFARLSVLNHSAMGRKGETMKVLRCTILICFLGRGVSAQQTATVSGQLKDSGRVIANQTVKLVSENETFETKTDENGSYRLTSIADGRYLLVYNNKQASVNIKGGQVSIAELAEVVQISDRKSVV